MPTLTLVSVQDKKEEGYAPERLAVAALFTAACAESNIPNPHPIRAAATNPVKSL